jgi:hypothetical protein
MYAQARIKSCRAGFSVGATGPHASFFLVAGFSQEGGFLFGEIVYRSAMLFELLFVIKNHPTDAALEHIL